VLHHGKEEALLFPHWNGMAYQRMAVPSVHFCGAQAGRELVSEFAEAIEEYASGADGAVAGLATKMKALAELYPRISGRRTTYFSRCPRRFSEWMISRIWQRSSSRSIG